MDIIRCYSISSFSSGQDVDEANKCLQVDITWNLKRDKNNIKMHGNSNNNMLDIY